MKKPGKPPTEKSKKANRAAKSDKVASENTTAKPVRRAGEGPGNLRQRAEWFRSRAGNAR
jgi:hypothetical protein